MSAPQVFVVDESTIGTRLDVFVTEKMPSVSRALVQKLCTEGKVLVGGEAGQARRKLKAGEKVTVEFDSVKLETIPDIELPIIYEDDDCVVIDKPSGLLTHSKGPFNPEPTVATWLRQHIPEHQSVFLEDSPLKKINERAGIVHRLDRATSGVMICAKNDAAMTWLQKQFSERKVKKTYLAVVAGQLEPSEAIIDMPIERNPKAPATFRVGPSGKAAQTHYKVIGTNGTYSLVELKPTTGRTHQLRVHLAQRGHPIVGDGFYHGQPAERLMLHALNLEITLPNRGRRTFEAPLPDDFRAIMKSP